MNQIIRFCGSIPTICFNLSFLLEDFRDLRAPTCFSVCFSKAFPKGEYANLTCSFICLWIEASISSPSGHPYLSNFPDDNADFFTASLLISYCSFSSLILSIVVISFYPLSKRLQYIFLKIHKVCKVSI